MTDTAPDAAPDQGADQQQDAQQDTTQDDGTDWKAEARKWEQRAKENRQAAQELEKQRKASMTEAERAIAEAETRGRTAASSEFGRRLARSSFDALAAKRNPEADTEAILEFVDLARFVGEDGEPDVKALQAAVDRLVPAAATTPGVPSFDGGARQSPAPVSDMSGLIRKAAGRA